MEPRNALSRRAFAGRAAALMAGSTVPILTEAALAQMSYSGEPPAGAVMLNANENPLGPCPEALEAMAEILRRGGRYLFGETMRLASTLAAQEGLPASHAQAYAGSSDPLHRAVLAFCGPARAYATADPGYEAGERAAAFVNAPIHRVKLSAGHAHDVRAMAAAAGRGAGVFYVCNPNNPTGTLTGREDIEWLVANKPAGSIVLIDEAYIHFCNARSAVDLVAAGKDVIVLRTFSKIYGMAGLRAGVALARPDLLERIRPFGTGFLPTTGMVGARVSLGVKGLIEQRRNYVQEIRDDVFAWLRSKGYRFVPSVSNKFMLDTGRPGREVVAALAAQGVFVGRSWPIWPNHIRVTIGTSEEMGKFKAAYAKVAG